MIRTRCAKSTRGSNPSIGLVCIQYLRWLCDDVFRFNRSYRGVSRSYGALSPKHRMSACRRINLKVPLVLIAASVSSPVWALVSSNARVSSDKTLVILDTFLTSCFRRCFQLHSLSLGPEQALWWLSLSLAQKLSIWTWAWWGRQDEPYKLAITMMVQGEKVDGKGQINAMLLSSIWNNLQLSTAVYVLTYPVNDGWSEGWSNVWRLGPKHSEWETSDLKIYEHSRTASTTSRVLEGVMSNQRPMEWWYPTRSSISSSKDEKRSNQLKNDPSPRQRVW